jgi:hypothetical protein
MTAASATKPADDSTDIHGLTTWTNPTPDGRRAFIESLAVIPLSRAALDEIADHLRHIDVPAS